MPGHEGDSDALLRQQSALARFGELALRADHLDDILTEACRLVSGALGTDLAKVMEVQPDGKSLLVRAGIGWNPGVVGVVTVTAARGTSEGHALQTGEPMISSDIDHDTQFEFPAFLIEHGVKAVANVAIIGRDGQRAYGVLQVDSRTPRVFTESDTAFLSTYANMIAAAVQRLAATADLREREARLRRSEDRFRRIAEIETVGVLFFDARRRIFDGNEVFLRMSGFTGEEVAAGQVTWEAITPPEWMPATMTALDQLAETGQRTPLEREYIRKDGSRWWGLSAGRMLDQGVGVELVLDVTDRKRAEQAVQDSEARLRALVEGIPQLVFRSHSSGERIWGSSQWIDYTGLPEARSLGLGWLDAIHPADREATMAAWAVAERDGRYDVEHRTYHAARGEYSWFQTRATPVRDGAGRVIEWFGTSTEIDDQVRARQMLAVHREELEAEVAARTADLSRALDSLQTEMAERERAEGALRHMQKMEAVGQLTGGIAHDFNNMLQGIAGSLEMAGRRAAEGRTDDTLRFLRPAQQALERAAGLTRRLLAFARRQRLEPKLVDADALVAGMADLIRRTVGPAVQLDLHLRDGRARVLCDPNELESALLNLCINARDAMPDGGHLIMGTADVTFEAADLAQEQAAQPGDYVMISVTDTGTGMPPDVLERAFEPFFTTKLLGHGTGLGLSQVYGFVQQSGGLVRLESVPGHGTTVSICLPQHLKVAPSVLPAETPDPKVAQPGQAILLVDDETIAREAMAARLGELGYRVLEAADGPAALSIVDGGAPVDLLVTDVGLPNGMNGRQVAEAVRERHPGVPVLFITGYAGTELPPGSEVIDKPFELNALARRVQGLLAK
ncbi:MAG: PAS domain S-box protein [Rhodospirillales bacterium]|nr:PAS domain S-box protein [Rhodospirillales bacterium]